MSARSPSSRSWCSLILLWALLRYLFTRPAAIAAYVRERRRQQGYDALSRGLLAIGVGDRTQAQRYAGIAGRNLPREPLTALLRAQAAQLKGDRAAARRAFEAMLDRPETELLGVRGLFLEAKRGNDIEAARALAEQAVKRDPKLGLGRQRPVRHAGARRRLGRRAEHARHRPPERSCRSRTWRSAAAPCC